MHRRRNRASPADDHRSDRGQRPADARCIGGCFTLVYNGELYNYVELREALERAGLTVRDRRRHRGRAAAAGAMGTLVPGGLRRHVGLRVAATSSDGSSALPRPLRQQAAVLHARRAAPVASARSRRACWRRCRARPDQATSPASCLGYADTGPQTSSAGSAGPRPPSCSRSVETRPARSRSAIGRRRASAEPGGEARGGGSASSVETAAASTPAATCPLGSCLSGGLDSSSIVCTASTLKARRPPPIHVPPSGLRLCPRRTNPSPSGRGWTWWSTARASRSTRRGRPLSDSRHPSRRSRASRMSRSARPASRRSGSSSRRPARAGMKVMLDGQGADEVLGGYHGYLATAPPAWSPIDGRSPTRGWRSTTAGVSARGPCRRPTVTGLLPARAPTVAGPVRSRAAAPPTAESHRRSAARSRQPLLRSAPDRRAAPDGPASRCFATKCSQPALAASVRGPQLDGALDRGARAVPRPPPGRARIPAPGLGEGAWSRHETTPAQGDEGGPSGADPDPPLQARLPRRPRGRRRASRSPTRDTLAANATRAEERWFDLSRRADIHRHRETSPTRAWSSRCGGSSTSSSGRVPTGRGARRPDAARHGSRRLSPSVAFVVHHQGCGDGPGAHPLVQAVLALSRSGRSTPISGSQTAWSTSVQPP